MKILIADDDPLVCQSLSVMLGSEKDFDIVGTAGNGKEALEFCREEAPDVVLMDIRMPVMDGIESTRRIKSEFPHIQVMMLTTFRDEPNIRAALQAGAKGYLIKSTAFSHMAEQLRALYAGSSVLDEHVMQTLVEPRAFRLEQLSEREHAIAERVAQGLSNKEIAEYLFLSVGTVRNTLSVILDKLELRDRTQLAIYYLRHNSSG